MKAETAKKFLACVGVHHTVEASGWLNCSCPLAPYTHEKGHDTQPSFGVRLDESVFNCFACGASGSMGSLLSTLLMYLQSAPGKMEKYDFKTAYLLLEGIELELDTLPEFTEFPDQKTFVPWPEWWLDQFPQASNHPEALNYLLNNRGLAYDQLLAQELRWDAWRQMIVCPYRTAFGVLAGARGRCIDPLQPKSDQHHEYKHMGINNSQLVWYNEQSLQTDGPIIVVEGQFDVMHLLQVTPNVIGNLTAKIPWPKLLKLTAKDDVIFMLDNDATGQMAMHGTDVYAGAIKLLEGKGPNVAVMEYPAEYKDPAMIPLDWLREQFTDVVPLTN